MMEDIQLPIQNPVAMPIVSVEQAKLRVECVIDEMHASKEHAALMRILAKSLPSFNLDGVDYLRLSDFGDFMNNFARAYEGRDSSLLIQKRGVKVERVVDVEEFVMSSEYMRQGGSVRPAIMSKLNEFFENPNYVEGVLCLAKDMRVPLLDGTNPTIEELAKMKAPDEKFWVYTRGKDGLCPAQARFPHKTGTDVLWRVNFTDGSSARGNARHQFLTSSGEKVQIKHLKTGDRIESMYLGKRKIGRGGEYQTIKQKDEKEVFVHRMVADFVFGERKGNVVHHKDFNKMNNDPTNLELLSWREHSFLHRNLAINNIEKYNSLPFSKRSENARKNAKKSLRWCDSEQRIEASERMKKRNLNGEAGFIAKHFWDSEEGAEEKDIRAERMHVLNLRHPNRRDDLHFNDLLAIASDCKVFAELCSKLDCSASKIYSLLNDGGMSYIEFRDVFMGYDTRQHRNHVVKSIECLGVKEDVYCLTVDSTGVFFVEVEGGDADGACILSSNTGAI